jgi:hypothetical protein
MHPLYSTITVYNYNNDHTVTIAITIVPLPNSDGPRVSYKLSRTPHPILYKPSKHTMEP